MPRLLIIDDERDVCEVLKETLEYDGFQVDSASSGREAIQLTGQNAYDAMIVDLRLEGDVSGVDVVRYFKNIPSRPKILITSGTPKSLIQSLLAREGIAGLIDAVLEKPGDLNPDVVSASLRRILRTA